MMKRILAAGVIVGGIAFVLPATAQNNNSETYRQLNLFGDVFERVRADYVEDVSDEELIEAAINGMLTSLDPHSSYLSPKNFKDMQVQTRGEFGGLGIEVTMENGYVKVVSPIDDTPAFRAGLKPNDLITHLDGEQVRGLTLSQAVERMRGKVGSDLNLTVRREGSEAFDVSVTRAVIKIRSVRSRMEGEDIGYVRISSFSEQTSSGVERAIKRFRDTAKDKLKGIVLDLRNNPGGLVGQAVLVADAFLEQGMIVATTGRDNKESRRFDAYRGDFIKGLPIVLLQNEATASAAEILSAALRDNRRAVIMGTRSYGKGIVQTAYPFGALGSLKFTTHKYLTATGSQIHGVGVLPDIFINGDPRQAYGAAAVAIDTCPVVGEAQDRMLGCAILFLQNDREIDRFVNALPKLQ